MNLFIIEFLAENREHDTWEIDRTKERRDDRGRRGTSLETFSSTKILEEELARKLGKWMERGEEMVEVIFEKRRQRW